VRGGVEGLRMDLVNGDGTFPPHPGPTALELGESTALFSLSSDGGGGEGRGEESRFYWISPLPNPLPARSSQREGDRRPPFQCLIQWQWRQGNTRSFSGNVFKAFPSPRSFLAGRGRLRSAVCSPCLCRLSCGLLSERGRATSAAAGRANGAGRS
jgi:hypothetical protein